MNKYLLCAVTLGTFVSHAAAGPLHNATRDGNVDQVKLLIASGEDVNKRDRTLGWPLHQAALNDSVEIAELLIAAGADVNVEHRTGPMRTFAPSKVLLITWLRPEPID